MIRPYLTVIRDSFRAATNSRVLYIVLALILLVLLSLAPFHVRETLDWKLSSENSFPATDRLFARLVDEGKSGKRAAVEHIWDKLSPEMQNDLEKAKEDPSISDSSDGPGGSPITRRLSKELNQLLENDDLYDEKAFDGKRLGVETLELIKKDSNRSSVENRRLNRLLLSTALRRDVVMPEQTQLDFYYFHWHWSAFTTNISHSAFASAITSQLPTYFDKFIMSIGIFIAILITASIIPEMLEPGSLNLLLSKPVHRWGLLLAKYIGGCVFILLFASLLFVGIWLWMGIQLGIWERAVLLSIPTYVFVFAMYYSVSVLAGVWFRSPILCITFAILFWAVCSAIGYSYAWLDYRHYNASAREMTSLGDDVVMVDMLQQHRVWDVKENRWRTPSSREITPEEGGFVFASFLDRLDEFPDLPGPVIDPENDRFLLVDSGIVDALSNSRLKLASTYPRNDWQMAARGGLPPSTRQILFSPRMGQLAVDQSGSVFQWTGKEQEDEAEPSSDNNGTEEKSDSEEKVSEKISSQISGLLKTGRDRLEYDEISTDSSFSIRSPGAVSLNPVNDEIAFYSNGNLVILALDDDNKYQVRLQEKIGNHDNDRMTAFVSCRGEFVFVMLGNGRFYQVGRDDLKVLNTEDLSHLAATRSFSASPDGKFVAVTLRSGQLWIYDATEKTVYSQFGISNHDVLACTFDEQGRLWLGDRFQAARCYDLNTGKEIISREPVDAWLTRSFRVVIRPLYRLFPKPSEFYKLVAHLSSSGDARGNPDIDLTKLPHRDDPWSPLRSGVVFTVLVLAITCFIFQRQDF